MITIGRMSAVSVSAPAMMLRPLFGKPRKAKKATKTVRPRRPYTIEGTPARLRMLMLMNRVSRLSGAYSSM